MNVVIAKESLLEGLQRVSNIVPQKPTLPVLSNVLLSADDDRLSISGTDMDIAITTTVPCQVGEAGAVTVDARRFLGIIRELPQGDITITVENDRVGVVFASGQSSLQGMSADDFPPVRDTIDGVSIKLEGTELALMVEKTGFSVSKDRTRLALTGIFWNIDSGSMTMVSTDGHRLSLFGRKMDIDTEQGAEAIVPPKTLLQAAQVISNGGELNNVVFGDGALLFDFGTTTIFSKLIEGPYPNFRQVIPQNNSKKVVVNTETLAASVRRVSVLSSSITHQIRIEVAPDQVVLATKNDDIGGEARETLEAAYEGEELVAGYNALFLSEILKRIDADEVVLELETPTTACIVRPTGGADTDEFIYLIMPLRLSE